MPESMYANQATEDIFSSSAENLGKGGVLGTISNAVKSATKSLNLKTTLSVINPVGYFGTQLARDVGKEAKNVPAILDGLAGKITSTIAQNPVAALSAGASLLGGGALTAGIGGAAGGEYGESGISSPDFDSQGNYIGPGNSSASATNYTPVLLAGGAAIFLYVIFSGRRRR
jgi:hypothetical protein